MTNGQRELTSPVASSTKDSRRNLDGSRRRSSSSEEYDCRVEFLMFCPNSKQQNEHGVSMRSKALKVMCESDKPLFDLLPKDIDTSAYFFCFKVDKGSVHALDENTQGVSTSSDQTVSASSLQFYTSPATLHSGIAIPAGSPCRPNRSSSPGTHVRMSVLQRFDAAPELEHAFMYCYLANMKEHSVDFDDSPLRINAAKSLSDVTDPLSEVINSGRYDVPEIGLTNERFRVKTPSLRIRGATIPLQEPHGELDLSHGALAVFASHDMRHYASGSCVLTIGSDGSVFVIPPPPRVQRLDVAVSALCVEDVRMRERAQSFSILPERFLGDGQEGMLTCVGSSSDKILLAIHACHPDDSSLVTTYVVEFGPFRPTLPWDEQLDRVQQQKFEFQHEEPIKKGLSYSSGASVQQIACGLTFSLVKLSDGSLWSWGMSTNGSLGHGPSVESLHRPKKISCNALRFVTVSCGTSHVGAICSNSDLYMWGSNHQGQLGLSREKDPNASWLFSKEKESSFSHVHTPTKVFLAIQGQGVLGIHQLSCGDYHTAVLTTTGTLPR
jgi:hypothetical protein